MMLRSIEVVKLTNYWSVELTMITTLHEWFEVNQFLVLFVYGQVFFVLGFGIVLRSRQHSRLNLALSLPWLAGFGFLHAINEWGDLFIPIQAEYLNPIFINLLTTVQLIILSLSFASLFQFGIELLRPLPERWRWLRLLPTLLLIIWFIGSFWVGLLLAENLLDWQLWANAFSRYLLCIPGGIIAGIGLKKQVKMQIQPYGLVQIERTLRIASIMLIIYAVLGGLVVKPLPIFPANIINTNTFSEWFLLPPAVYRSMVGLVLSVTIIRALEVFDLETQRLIHQMEENQIVSLERERIARDLHDGVLQQVYAAGLLAQSLKRQSPEPLSSGLDRLILTINQSIDQLRSFLIKDRTEIENIELIPALELALDEARRLIEIDTRWETPQTHLLSAEQINHLVTFTREALSNSIRHSKTERLEIGLECVNDQLTLYIRDFGKGLPENPETGFGLRNMRDRARLLGADLRFESKVGEGTTVILQLPMGI